MNLAKIVNKFVIYLFVLGPIIAVFFVKYLGVAYNNAMTAFVYLGFLVFVFQYLVEKKRIVLKKYIIFFIFFVLYTLFSDFFISHKTINIKYIYSNRYLPTMMMFILIENFKFEKKTLNVIRKVSYFILFISFLVIIYQQFVDSRFFVNEDYSFYKWVAVANEAELRLPSIFTWINPVTNGYYFVPVLSIFISYYFIKNNMKMVYFLYIIGFVFTFLTRDRWIILNYLILVIMYLIYKKIKLFGTIRYIIFIIIIVVSSFFVIKKIGVPVDKVIQNRILEQNKGGLLYGSAATRLLAIEVFLKLYPRHPILGRGYSLIVERGGNDYQLSYLLGGRSSQIHVGYLSLFYWYGLIGGILYLLFIYYLMKELLNHAKITNFWGAFLGMLGFVLSNFTLVYLAPFEIGLFLCLIFDKYFIDQYNS